MKVLVACECSGHVRDAFLSRGHEAMSADLKPTETPGPHYQGNVLDLMSERWDLVVAHPPCTLHGAGAPTQYVQPYEFGHPWTKATGLWLRGLPPLIPTDPLEGRGGRHAYRGRFPSWCGQHRDPTSRAVTFAGLAAAIAEQWGDLDMETFR